MDANDDAEEGDGEDGADGNRGRANDEDDDGGAVGRAADLPGSVPLPLGIVLGAMAAEGCRTDRGGDDARDRDLDTGDWRKRAAESEIDLLFYFSKEAWGERENRTGNVLDGFCCCGAVGSESASELPDHRRW